MARSRRAVFVCCDGLGRDWVRSDTTPVLHDIAGTSLWCAEHSAVFPSVTRVSAASVSTGCFPARHGLHGNRMGLIEGDRIVDLLFHDGRFERFEDGRIQSRNTHGTGCTLASAIAAGLAQGMSLHDAVARARAYVRRAIETAPGYGRGHGPLNHAVTVRSP